MNTAQPATETDATWQAELARRERTLALARKHAGEQGTKAAWRTVYNAEDSIRAWEAVRPSDVVLPPGQPCACGSPETYSLNPTEVVVHAPDGCTIERAEQRSEP